MAKLKESQRKACFNHAVEIPSGETGRAFFEDYLMQQIGLLADKLVVELRRSAQPNSPPTYRLSLGLEEVRPHH